MLYPGVRSLLLLIGLAGLVVLPHPGADDLLDGIPDPDGPKQPVVAVPAVRRGVAQRQMRYWIAPDVLGVVSVGAVGHCVPVACIFVFGRDFCIKCVYGGPCRYGSQTGRGLGEGVGFLHRRVVVVVD